MEYKHYLRFRSTEMDLLKKVENIINSGWLPHEFSGPHPLPKKIKRFSINRSHHLHKKSQEQLEIIEYSTFWIIHTPLKSNHPVLTQILAFEGLLFDWKIIQDILVLCGWSL